MKKLTMILFFILLIACFLFSACQNSEAQSADLAPINTADVDQQGILSAEQPAETAVPNPGKNTTGSEALPEIASEAQLPSEEDASRDQTVQTGEHTVYDVDVTEFSSTMVYSQVYQMMSEPESYCGKTAKMKGLYAVAETPEQTYFVCIIQDATACCAQGIEFVLTDDYAYPDDYPSPNDEIVVAGTFSTYYEGEQLYCTLKDAVLLEP